MTAGVDDPGEQQAGQQDYRTLPSEVPLEETIASVEPDLAPDPDAVRNVDQHRALRDD